MKFLDNIMTCHYPMFLKKKRLKVWYKMQMNQELNLDNPKLFTEKIQCYKLYYNLPDMRQCVDKYLFKQYITQKIGGEYIASLIDVWEKPEDVNIKDIPYNKFVIKSTLQSDGKYIILVEDKNKLDIEKKEAEIKQNWFNKRNLLTNSFCRAYYGAKPRVIVEEYIEEFKNSVNDYKVFCFNGQPEFFYVAEEHFENGENTSTYPITFFDLNWQVMDVSYGSHMTNEKVAKPKHIAQMLKIAENLSANFPFVRVDFFDTDEKLYLAELTFYPGGGLVPYHPESFNLKMGNMLNIKNSHGDKL